MWNLAKKWVTILDEYTENKSFDKSEKKNVLILGHTPTHTSDWKRMFDLFMRVRRKGKPDRTEALLFDVSYRTSCTVRFGDVFYFAW